MLQFILKLKSYKDGLRNLIRNQVSFRNRWLSTEIPGHTKTENFEQKWNKLWQINFIKPSNAYLNLREYYFRCSRFSSVIWVVTFSEGYN